MELYFRKITLLEYRGAIPEVSKSIMAIIHMRNDETLPKKVALEKEGKKLDSE